MQGKVVVITGASAGIGAALAQLVAARGGQPVLVSRNRKALEAVAVRCGLSARVLAADVTDRAAVERVAAQVIADGGLDVWVNNAGRGISRPVSQLTDDDLDAMWTTNVKSVVYGMQAVLPHFRARGAGHIVNVSSMLGRVPFAPQRSAYAAAKSAMNTLSASLRLELRGTGIHVSVVHPGVVATAFGANALHGGIDNRQIPGAQSAEEVAAVIADVIERPRADVYTRPEARGLVAAYYGAEDVAVIEGRPPFVTPRAP